MRSAHRGKECGSSEISRFAATYAREQLGLKVLNKPFEPGTIRDEVFDAVVLWDVIEHLPDPHAALREVYRLLRVGGWCAFSTGNIASTAAHLFGSRWHLFNVPEHLFYFTPNSAEQLLGRSGLRLIATLAQDSHPSPDARIQTDPVRSWLRLSRRAIFQITVEETMSVNKVILVGRLGRDPETRYTGGGQAVANFSVATDETYKDRNGERQKRTEWHKIVVWGKQAEIAQQYLKKGSLIFVEGRIQSREWQDKEGQKRTSFEIVANNFRMLGGRADGAAMGAAAGARTGGDDFDAPSAPADEAIGGHAASPEISDEDIPF